MIRPCLRERISTWNRDTMSTLRTKKIARKAIDVCFSVWRSLNKVYHLLLNLAASKCFRSMKVTKKQAKYVITPT